MLRSLFVTLWVIAGLSGCGADSTVETSPAVRLMDILESHLDQQWQQQGLIELR